MANLTASNSTLNGDSFVALLVQSVWNVTANSNVTNLTNTASTISFTPPTGGAFKTLTAVNHVGNGGTTGLNIFLGADGSPQARDRLRSGERCL